MKKMLLFLSLTVMLIACNAHPDNFNTEIKMISEKDISFVDNYQPTPTENFVAEIPGLPRNFDRTSYKDIGKYFIYLLSGGETDVPEIKFAGHDLSEEALTYSTIKYCIDQYKSSIFYGDNIKVIEFKFNSEQAYEILLDIQWDNTGLLKLGEQTWILEIAEPVLGEIYTIKNLYPISRKEKYPQKDWYQDNYTFYIFTNMFWGYGGKYSSPAEIPKESQTKYIMVNVPPSEEYATETEASYIPSMKGITARKCITDKDMNLWSQKLFGTEFNPKLESLERMPGYIEEDKNGNDIYVTEYAWDPIFWGENFIKSFEVGDEIHYYYEITNNDYALTPIPTKILEYTIKDNMVWSCVDVSDEVGLSIY